MTAARTYHHEVLSKIIRLIFLYNSSQIILLLTQMFASLSQNLPFPTNSARRNMLHIIPALLDAWD
jgi:hypothetical protein